MNKEIENKKVLSGDQAVFSQWDSLIKLHGFRKDNDNSPIHHQFHLADALGRSNHGLNIPHVTNEFFSFRNGKEIQPSWFAVSEIMPPFSLMYTSPKEIGNYVGEKFESFAKNVEKSFALLTQEDTHQIQDTIGEMGFPHKIPKTTNEVYEQLTQGNWYGIVDHGNKSASEYEFSEIAPAQRNLLLKLYSLISNFTPQEKKQELKKRFRTIADENGEFSNVIKGKKLDEAATEVFKIVSSRIEKLTGKSLEDITIGETTNYFELPKDDQLNDSKKDPFLFFNWYLNNRKLYDESHNEIAEELSKSGENPIQPIAKNKGEAPFWVIIDGEKNKLHLVDNSVKIVKRTDEGLSENTANLEEPLSNINDLANILRSQYENKKISVMPTAIGLMLNLRATGDVLLPEQGSHYTEQANLVWQRIIEKASPDQIDALPQNDIIRTHPNAISAFPSNHRIKLPWYLSSLFEADLEGFTNTDDLKSSWEDITQSTKEQLINTSDANTLLEKARILFSQSKPQYVFDLIENIEQAGKIESKLKTKLAPVLEKIKSELDKSQIRLLGQVSGFSKGEDIELPTGIVAIEENADALNELRSNYIESNPGINRASTNETILKYLVALKARQLQGGIESMEYFNARPSLLSLYLLFGEEGVKNVINTSETYKEETPRHIEKNAYSAEGNRILVVNDKTDRLQDKKSKLTEKITNNLLDGDFDTGIILTPSDDPNADYLLTIIGKDGSVGGMCGNGVRAAARYAYEAYGKNEVRLKTSSNEIVIGFKDDETYGARLSQVVDHNLAPVSTGNKNTLIDEINQTTTLDLSNAQVIAVRSILEEPHMIVKVNSNANTDELRNIAIKLTGAKASDGQPLFPQSININFLLENTDNYELLTYERAGVNEFTGSCGTGAICASSVIFEQKEIDSVNFRSIGGELSVSHEDEHYIIKGNVEKL